MPDLASKRKPALDRSLDLQELPRDPFPLEQLVVPPLSLARSVHPLHHKQRPYVFLLSGFVWGHGCQTEKHH